MVFFKNVTSNRTACPSCGKPYLPVRMETECSRCGSPLHVSANAPPESASRKWARLTDPGKIPPEAKQLIRVKGRRKLAVRQVELSTKSLNSGDAFVLDAGTKIFLWNGKAANPMEKAKATDCALRMKNKDKKGKAEIVVLEEGKANNEDDEEEFWNLLGGRVTVLTAEEGGEDDAVEHKDTLYSVIMEETGQVVISPLIYPRLLKEMLDSSHCFVFDCYSELYVWHGSSCAPIERQRSLSFAEELAKREDIQRPSWLSALTIREGEEPVLFMEKFYNGGSLPIAVSPGVSLPTQPKPPPKPFDLNTMFTTHLVKEKPPVDNGHGKIKMWKVTHSDKEEIPQNEHGHFYSEESYVFLYTYIPKNRDEYLIYFWQGQDSPITEKGASAVLTIHLHASIGGMAPQIRVVQGREPRHFLLMFPNLIIHKGSRDKSRPDLSLYQVHSNTVGTKAIEIAPNSLYLDTMESFIISRQNEAPVVWIGARCPFETKQYSLALAKFIDNEKETLIVNENDESVDWIWKDDTSYQIKQAVSDAPRLFQCSLASGFFTADRILDFIQEDLVEDDCFLLDCHDEAFVWIGKTSTEDEKKRTLEITIDYFKAKQKSLHPELDESGDNALSLPRSLIIPSGQEPLQFTRHFHAWRHKVEPSSDLTPYILVEDRLKEFSRTYTLKELWTRPPGLDYTALEKYLSDADFEDLFHCKRDEFAQMTEWKRTNLKKKWKLF
eukprot:TRINITY_DN3277_c0_g2_i3.p1 TRINITY_DN3277_c0_g2~~TRINITY_DN3277_c0_g2_i3.p1  ORF type:complete len:722 (+),score=130.20 TRINITY_DN3277_c0_g2_i3:253-2418(+)